MWFLLLNFCNQNWPLNFTTQFFLSALLQNCFLCWGHGNGDVPPRLGAALLCSSRAGSDLGLESGLVEKLCLFGFLFPRSEGETRRCCWWIFFSNSGMSLSKASDMLRIWVGPTHLASESCFGRQRSILGVSESSSSWALPATAVDTWPAKFIVYGWTVYTILSATDP